MVENFSDTHIALVIEGTYPWYRGGVSEWIAQYIAAFPDVNFCIIQIATDPFLQTDLSDGLYAVPKQVKKFQRIPPPAYSGDWQTGTAAWLNNHAETIAPAFRAADMIHVANTGFAGWLGLQFAQRCHTPLILTEHALYWKEVQMGAVALECGYKVPTAQDQKKQMANQFKQMASQIYHAADEIVSVSECNIANQKEMGARHVQYIPNGVKQSWLRPKRPIHRNQFPMVGWIGRCAEMKNPLKFFEVINAFEGRGGNNNHFIMMICDANEPELQQKVIKRAESYAQLTLVHNKAAENYLPNMDALCITSHNESQPLVLFEALANKVLPFGWSTGDVTDKYAKVLQAGSSAASVVDALMQLWQQPVQWKEAVNQRYERVKQRHTWTAIFNQYRKLFEPYLKKPALHE